MTLPHVAPAEMEVLRYILGHAPITVRDVGDEWERTKGQTRTTVLNVMERLRQKGYLQRELQNGVYQYSPTRPARQMQMLLVKNFVTQAFGGSIEPFLAYLTDEANVSEEDLDELKEIVASLDSRRDESKGRKEGAQ